MNNFPDRVIRPSTGNRPWFVDSSQRHEDRTPSLVHHEQQQLHGQRPSSHQISKPHEEQMEVNLKLSERHHPHQVPLEQHQQPGLSEQHQTLLEQHHVLLELQKQHHVLLQQQQLSQSGLPQHQMLPERHDQKLIPSAKLHLSERGHEMSSLVYLEQQTSQLLDQHGMHGEQQRQSTDRHSITKKTPGISETFRQIANQHGIAVTSSQSSVRQHLGTVVMATSSPHNPLQQYSKTTTSSNMESFLSANRLDVTMTTSATSSSNPFSREASGGVNPVTFAQSTGIQVPIMAPGTSRSAEQYGQAISSTTPALPSLGSSAGQNSGSANFSNTQTFSPSTEQAVTVLEKQYGSVPNLVPARAQHVGASTLPNALPSGEQHDSSSKSQGDFGPTGLEKPSARQMTEYFPLPVPLSSQSVEKNQTKMCIEEPALKCDHCSFRFSTAAELKQHFLAHFEQIVHGTSDVKHLPERQSHESETSTLRDKGHSDSGVSQQDNTFLTKSANDTGIGESSSAENGTTYKSVPGTSVLLADSKLALESHMDVDPVQPFSAEKDTPSMKTKKKVEKNHPCSVCAKRFSRLDHLRRHFNKCHSEMTAMVKGPGGETCTPHHLGLIRSKPPSMNIRENDGPFDCFICGKSFKRPDHMKRHVIKIHPDCAPVDTPRLPITMKFNVCSHYGRHTPTKRPKSTAPKLPSSPPVYTEADMAEKRHVCITCDMRFKRQDHLKRHVRIHTGEKPFTCVVCGTGFRREHHLQRHERTHTGEKPYECVNCGKKFSREDHMKKHNRSHIFDSIRKPGEHFDINSIRKPGEKKEEMPELLP